MLGLQVAKNVSWNKHIASIENKAGSALYRKSQFKYTPTKRSLEKVYVKYIIYIKEYADIVWAGGNIANLDILEMVQNDSVHVVTGATVHCSNTLIMCDN